MKTYTLSESWGDGAHYIGEYPYEELSLEAQAAVDADPDAGEWGVELEDAPGLTLVIREN